MVASGGTDRGNIATTASHQGTGMAMTATADLSTALQAIIIGRTEEVGHQPAIPPITVDNPTRVPAVTLWHSPDVWERRVWRYDAPSRRPVQPGRNPRPPACLALP